ncbi:putative quinol monooxygenase [Streptomyces sp. NPDC060031]|uniref:putative quinol monooxygenase n=1 Tax=Streptomyces sp. NPDC060031 TaxID=3347043 RepID=UPI00369DDB1F
MVIVEEWADRQALELHFTTPHFRHVAEVLDDLLEAPFTIRHLRPADSRADHLSYEAW